MMTKPRHPKRRGTHSLLQWISLCWSGVRWCGLVINRPKLKSQQVRMLGELRYVCVASGSTKQARTSRSVARGLLCNMVLLPDAPSTLTRGAPDGRMRKRVNLLPPEPEEVATLMYKQLADGDIVSLARDLKFHRTLKMLDLRCNKFGDVGAAAIAEAVMDSARPALSVIRLAGNNISDAGATQLAAMLRQNTTVGLLGLNANIISDDGANALLAAVAARQVVTTLILSGNNIFDVEVQERVEALKRAPAPLIAGGTMSAMIAGSRQSTTLRRKETMRSMNPRLSYKPERRATVDTTAISAALAGAPMTAPGRMRSGRFPVLGETPVQEGLNGRTRRRSRDSSDSVGGLAVPSDINGIPLGEPETLPGGMSPQEAMEDVLRELKPKFVQDVEARRFAALWVKRTCRELLLAFAWHAVCAHVPVEDAAQADDQRERFHAKVTVLHTTLFANSTITTETKDLLAWYLPDALARTTMIALVNHYPTFFALPGSKGPKEISPAGERLRDVLFREFVQWTSGFGAATGRSGAVSVLASKGGVLDMVPPHMMKSMPVGEMPSVRRELRDVSACSPLVMEWLKLRHQGGGGRGGSSSAREVHRVRCSTPWDGRLAESASTSQGGCGDGEREERGADDDPVSSPRVVTYRDVRKDARRLADRLATDFGRETRDTYARVKAENFMATLAVGALLKEKDRMTLDKTNAHEYANFLVSYDSVEREYAEESNRADTKTNPMARLATPKKYNVARG